MKIRTVFTILSVLTLGSSLHAEEKAVAETNASGPASGPIEEWKANAGLSAIINTGNSSNQTVGGNALTSYRKEQNKIEWSGAGNYGRARDNGTGVTSTNTKNWNTLFRYDRYVAKPLSLFGLGRIGADEPAGYDLFYGGAGGLSHELWTVAPNYFKYEVGFDYTREERLVPPSDDIYSGRVFLQYKHTFATWAFFSQDVESLFNIEDSDDIRLNTLSTLGFQMTTKVAFQTSYGIRFDNVPVPGNRKTDTTTQVGLVVNFL